MLIAKKAKGTYSKRAELGKQRNFLNIAVHTYLCPKTQNRERNQLNNNGNQGMEMEEILGFDHGNKFIFFL